MAGPARAGSVGGLDGAASRTGPGSVRPAGAGLARCPALQQPDGHRTAGAPGPAGGRRLVGAEDTASLTAP